MYEFYHSLQNAEAGRYSHAEKCTPLTINHGFEEGSTT